MNWFLFYVIGVVLVFAIGVGVISYTATILDKRIFENDFFQVLFIGLVWPIAIWALLAVVIGEKAAKYKISKRKKV